MDIHLIQLDVDGYGWISNYIHLHPFTKGCFLSFLGNLESIYSVCGTSFYKQSGKSSFRSSSICLQGQCGSDGGSMVGQQQMIIHNLDVARATSTLLSVLLLGAFLGALKVFLGAPEAFQVLWRLFQVLQRLFQVLQRLFQVLQRLFQVLRRLFAGFSLLQN